MSNGGVGERQKKKEVGDACAERRSDARSAHTKAIEACQDILNESLYQVRDVRAYQLPHP